MPLYTARCLFPVAGPPLPQGAVLTGIDDDGRERIRDVGPCHALTRRHPGEPLRDLGEVALFPGLVNAHTHLELSWTAGVDLPGGDMVDWVRALLAARASVDETAVADGVAWAIDACVERGVVAVGDIANTAATSEALEASPLDGVIFHELLAADPAAADAVWSIARRRGTAGDRWRTVPTPHAPHTTSPALIRRCVEAAEADGAPLSIHVAESAAEAQLIRSGDGPFRDLFADRGGWDPAWTQGATSPIAALDERGALGPRTLAVHAVHVDAADIERLRRSGATVVTCPRSNRFLNCGVAPIPELVAAGVPLAIGTDSLATSPDLDPWAELAALLATHPGLDRATALAGITAVPARALGLDDRVGTLEPGREARIIAVPWTGRDDDPHAGLGTPPDHVWALDAAPYLERTP